MGITCDEKSHKEVPILSKTSPHTAVSVHEQLGLPNHGHQFPFPRITSETPLTKKVKVKFSRYRPGVAHRVGRGIALLFHDRGTRRG